MVLKKNNTQKDKNELLYLPSSNSKRSVHFHIETTFLWRKIPWLRFLEFQLFREFQLCTCFFIFSLFLKGFYFFSYVVIHSIISFHRTILMRSLSQVAIIAKFKPDRNGRTNIINPIQIKDRKWIEMTCPVFVFVVSADM